jgi:large subunit ribosomal protein L20
MAGFNKKKYFKLAKGFYGRSKNCLRLTIPRVEKSLQKAYIGRKLRPRTMRSNWIMTISAATRDLSLPYSRFINYLNNSTVKLNRKILSDLAINEPYSFKAVFDEVCVAGERLPEERVTIEGLIRKNLITAARLEKEMYAERPV